MLNHLRVHWHSLARVSACVAVLGIGLVAVDPAQAVTPGSQQSNPYNSPLPRANPNTQQGTSSSIPPLRGPSTQPIRPAPTLQNRGIGNGENLRREPQKPRLEPSRPARESLRTP